MTPRGYAAYNAVAVNTVQDKGKILLMLYDDAVKNIRSAQEGIRGKSPKMRGEAISRVIGIVNELDCALDRDVGGDLTNKLSSLYQWVLRALTQANFNNDTKVLEDVKRVLETIKEGFEGAINKDSESAPALQQQVEPAVRPRSLNLAV